MTVATVSATHRPNKIAAHKRQARAGESMAALRDTIYRKLRAILSESLGADEDEITWETNVYDDLNADTLEFHDEVIPLLEEEFEISIDDSDVPDLTTVRELVGYIMEAI